MIEILIFYPYFPCPIKNSISAFETQEYHELFKFVDQSSKYS